MLRCRVRFDPQRELGIPRRSPSLLTAIFSVLTIPGHSFFHRPGGWPESGGFPESSRPNGKGEQLGLAVVDDPGSPPWSLSMDLARLKELIDLMNRHQLEELEVEEENFRIRLRKRGERIKEVVTIPPAAALPVVSATAAPTENGSKGSAEDGTIVPSPMVGTFYRSANPDAEPFVEVGDRIEKERVICFIEAMKVMNEIKSDVAGTLTEAFVENGEPVEYGQPLFRVST